MSSYRFVLAIPLLLVSGCAGGGGGGGGGGTGGPVTPPSGPTAFVVQAGLESAVPGPGVIRVEFTPPPSAAFEVAAFVSTNRLNVFASTPRVPAAGATSITLSGLTNGVVQFIGLGIRPTTGGAYQQTGPTLSATPGNPLFVDAASTAANPDGLTPATAYPSVFNAALAAFQTLFAAPTKSVNLWVKGGSYSINTTLPITAGVNIYGGFGPAFDLASRSVENTPTIWNVGAGQSALQFGDQVNNQLAVVLDGIRIVGNGVGRVGIDTDGTDPCQLELREVDILDMADRGLRLRNLTDQGFDVLLTRCQVSLNGSDGLNGSGPFDYSIFNSVFASNTQEGLDLRPVTVETGGVARVRVINSQFFGNGGKGLDCAMGAALFPSLGSYQVEVRGCAFERNALEGCLVDGDFELLPGYSADVIVRDCMSRGNSGDGFHFDLDAPLDTAERLTAFATGLLATGNGLNGIYVTSESRPGMLAISTSVMVGNLGAGLRIEGPPTTPGNRSVEVAHCLFASNFSGGMISRDIPSSATSSIAYLQSNAFDAKTVQVGCVTSNSPDALAFVNAPEEYAHVTSRSGATLTLAAPATFPLAAKLELADDGAQLAAATIANTVVTLATPPTDFGAPGLLSAFAPNAPDVEEDYRLAGGSIAIGAGMAGADAGPAASPYTGVIGRATPTPPELFYPLATTPELSATVGANQSIVVEFSKPLNAGSFNASSVRVRRGANSIQATIQTAGARLTLVPPGGGWGTGSFRVELDGARASDGTRLSGAFALPFTR